MAHPLWGGLFFVPSDGVKAASATVHKAQDEKPTEGEKKRHAGQILKANANVRTKMASAYRHKAGLQSAL